MSRSNTPHTALSSMEMYCLEIFASWNNSNLCVALELVSPEDETRPATESTYPQTPAEINFKNNLLMSSKDVQSHQPHCFICKNREKPLI